MYTQTVIIDSNFYFQKHGFDKLDAKTIGILRRAINDSVRRAALNAAGAGNYFHDSLEDVYRFKSDAAFETFVTDLSAQALGDLITPLSMSQANVLPFAFTHVVPNAEVMRRAERLEAEAGLLPWLDWTDFLDRAETGILKEFRSVAQRNNMRQHKIERDWSNLTLDMPVICSFINETDMVMFRVGI